MEFLKNLPGTRCFEVLVNNFWDNIVCLTNPSRPWFHNSYFQISKLLPQKFRPKKYKSASRYSIRLLCGYFENFNINNHVCKLYKLHFVNNKILSAAVQRGVSFIEWITINTSLIKQECLIFFQILEQISVIQCFTGISNHKHLTNSVCPDWFLNLWIMKSLLLATICLINYLAKTTR